MENMKYTTLMVEDTPSWQQDVAKLLEGLNGATARQVAHQKNGRLIKVGAPDAKTIKTILDRVTEFYN